MCVYTYSCGGCEGAVCCNAFQCVAVSCSQLHCVAVRCIVLQSVAVCCSVLRCVAVSCSVLQLVAACCSALQRVAVYHPVRENTHSITCVRAARPCCSVLQCVLQCVCSHHDSCHAYQRVMSHSATRTPRTLPAVTVIHSPSPDHTNAAAPVPYSPNRHVETRQSCHIYR